MLESVLPFLDAPRQAVLATVSSGGMPHQAVVDYWLVDGNVHVSAQTDRLWARHLRRNPQISFLVHDATDIEHWVGIKGTVEVSAEGQAAIEEAVALAVRYGDEPEDRRGAERVSFRIVPQRLFQHPPDATDAL